jgi:hypothetical protein
MLETESRHPVSIFNIQDLTSRLFLSRKWKFPIAFSHRVFPFMKGRFSELMVNVQMRGALTHHPLTHTIQTLTLIHCNFQCAALFSQEDQVDLLGYIPYASTIQTFDSEIDQETSWAMKRFAAPIRHILRSREPNPYHGWTDQSWRVVRLAGARAGRMTDGSCWSFVLPEECVKHGGCITATWPLSW